MLTKLQVQKALDWFQYISEMYVAFVLLKDKSTRRDFIKTDDGKRCLKNSKEFLKNNPELRFFKWTDYDWGYFYGTQATLREVLEIQE